MASSIILHVDMDAFFASVEQLDNPELIGKCLVVGGMSQRGVVAAASYEARKYGIHSAMPIFQARQKCADLVIVPPRRKRYMELSGRIMGILRGFSPLVEPLSIDEAFVDITGCTRLYGEPNQIACNIKEKILENTNLTCSIGVAPNKFLAKIASDYEKPDGLTLIPPQRVMPFIQNLPIDKVPGVGVKARKALYALGIQTLGDVGRVGQETLIRKLGKFGYRLIDLAHGRDDTPVIPHSATKSVSSEITLHENTRDRHVLEGHLLIQAQAVARQLRKKNMIARVVILKIKTADFQGHTRSRTLTRANRSSEMIYRTAVTLLETFPLTQPVRLVGVSAGGLLPDDTPFQQDLFEKERNNHTWKWEEVDRALDAVVQRYGHPFVIRGALVGSKGKGDDQSSEE